MPPATQEIPTFRVLQQTEYHRRWFQLQAGQLPWLQVRLSRKVHCARERKLRDSQDIRSLKGFAAKRRRTLSNAQGPASPLSRANRGATGRRQPTEAEMEHCVR